MLAYSSSGVWLSNNPYRYYELEKLNSPFGAINTNGSSLNSTVYAGYTSIENAQYGLPYSCVNGHNDTIYVNGSNKTPCEALQLNINNYKISPATSSFDADLSYGSLVGNSHYENSLKRLFIKSKSIGSVPSGATYTFPSSYNYTSSSNISECTSEDLENNYRWCAIYPTISNIKLLNNLSINVSPDSNGKFNVIRPGFYYVTFNTNVNEEQTPISKLTLRVYKEGDDWTSDTGIKELDNLDAKPLSTNPHKIGIFLSSGTYQIMAKVVDNWTKFGCTSSPSKDFSSVNSNCGKCCAGNETIPAFKDNTNCRFCF
jgi:hypothetical protein